VGFEKMTECKTDYFTTYDACPKCEYEKDRIIPKPAKIKNCFRPHIVNGKWQVEIINGKSTIYLTRSEIERLEGLCDRWGIEE